MLKPFSRESEIRKKEKLQEKNQRKRRKIIRASFEPLLPGLIRMVYWGMIVLPFCSVAVELIACLGHKNDGTWELFWKNSGYSYFFCWLFFGVVTAALCVIQIVRTEKFGYSEKVYRFADEIPYAELFLYQSGYLTIKGYVEGIYLLGIPNNEVRKALYKIVLPALTLKSNAQVVSTQNMLQYSLKMGDLSEAMECLKALIADVPYSNKKLASMDMEERYRLILSTIFNAIGCRVQVEKMIATGRIDMVVETSTIIYVLELKLSNNGGVDAAAEQIKAKQYAEPFKADKRKITALAIELDDLGKGLVAWKAI